MAEFKDGIEAAAAVIEAMEPGILGSEPSPELLAKLAAIVRAIEPPANGTAVALVADLDAAFTQFATIYAAIGGHRNPKSVTARGWDPARKNFKRLVTKQKHAVSAILSGTRAFAAYSKEHDPTSQYVWAPEVFLNKEQFLKNWSVGAGRARRDSLFDVEADLRER